MAVLLLDTFSNSEQSSGETNDWMCPEMLGMPKDGTDLLCHMTSADCTCPQGVKSLGIVCIKLSVQHDG